MIMYEIRFIKIYDTVSCHLGKKGMCIGVGLGDNKIKAFMDLLKMCWKYGKMMKLLRVRKIIGGI